MKFISASDAVAHIKSCDRVFIQGAAATPLQLIDELVRQNERLSDVEIIQMHTEGVPSYADRKYSKSFRVMSLFVGANLRSYLDYDRVDYIPCFLSEIPQLFRSGIRPLDVALIHVSPPDKHGYCSLGVSVDIAHTATLVAKTVIAQVNPRMPRVHGDGIIHVSRIHHLVEVDEPLPERLPKNPTPSERAIGKLVAGLVENGATLQIGIGAVPDAVLAELKGHRHLGIHTETWSDGTLGLIQAGSVDNSQKKVHPGKTVSGFILGSKAVYDFINDNPSVAQFDIDYVNSPTVIARNPKVTAINSAVEVDLTGQVCADSVGARIVSGVGGQMDFMRGAALSEKGKPIIALLSRTARGESRIVSSLKAAAGVVTTRAHVRFIVTEFGVADLYGRSLGERAKLLIEIAHPEDRERLQREWRSLHAR